jgi:uncharacterized protein (DUF2141 family)
MKPSIIITAVAFMLLSGSLVRANNKVEVVITGIQSGKGEIGCSIFASESGFPMDAKAAISSQWVEAKAEGVTFIFENLEPGSYAVSVSHDLNGNRKTDTNFLGIPKEDWGVSNNARPALRAPRFEEASFKVTESITIEIELD